jgi:hypothetical protein
MMAAWKNYLNSHFSGCRKVAEGFDPHRQREIKVYAIPGEFDCVGQSDGTDAFIVPLSTPFMSNVAKAMKALLAGEDIGVVQLEHKKPEGFKSPRKRVVVGAPQQQQELPLEPAPVRRRVTAVVSQPTTRRRVIHVQQ